MNTCPECENNDVLINEATEEVAEVEENILKTKMTEEELADAPPSNVYQNYDAKAEENKSSAVSLLLVGCLGAVVVALSWFDILPFSIGGSGNWFSHSVLFAFFVIFIICGVISACNVKKYRSLVVTETDTKAELMAYLKEHFTLELLEEISADTEEEAYFKRMTLMRDEMKAYFEGRDFDAILMESLLDQFYDEIFG